MNDISIHAFQRVRIGRREFPFTTCEAVSRAYRGTIERLGIGGSETPPCNILNAAGEIVGHVSFNGRVWLGDERSWISGKRPIYDPNGILAIRSPIIGSNAHEAASESRHPRRARRRA